MDVRVDIEMGPTGPTGGDTVDEWLTMRDKMRPIFSSTLEFAKFVCERALYCANGVQPLRKRHFLFNTTAIPNWDRDEQRIVVQYFMSSLHPIARMIRAADDSADGAGKYPEIGRVVLYSPGGIDLVCYCEEYVSESVQSMMGFVEEYSLAKVSYEDEVVEVPPPTEPTLVPTADQVPPPSIKTIETKKDD